MLFVTINKPDCSPLGCVCVHAALADPAGVHLVTQAPSPALGLRNAGGCFLGDVVGLGQYGTYPTVCGQGAML